MFFFEIETWRQLWINLAEAEKELGLMQISDEMIGELKAQKSNINWEMVKAEEKRLRHDVMAHNHCYGMVSFLPISLYTLLIREQQSSLFNCFKLISGSLFLIYF